MKQFENMSVHAVSLDPTQIQEVQNKHGKKGWWTTHIYRGENAATIYMVRKISKIDVVRDLKLLGPGWMLQQSDTPSKLETEDPDEKNPAWLCYKSMSKHYGGKNKEGLDWFMDDDPYEVIRKALRAQHKY